MKTLNNQTTDSSLLVQEIIFRFVTPGQKEATSAEPDKPNLANNRIISPLRCGRFTASEIWKLMGEPRTKAKDSDPPEKRLTDQAKSYILEKIAEEMTGQALNSSADEAMMCNLQLKKKARELFHTSTGKVVIETDFTPFEESAGGTPDGLVEAEDALLQIKAPNDSAMHLRHWMVQNNDDLYRLDSRHAAFYQCQANMMFSQRDKCYFISYDPRVKDVRWMMYIVPIIPDVDAWLAISAKLDLALKYKKQIIDMLIS